MRGAAVEARDVEKGWGVDEGGFGVVFKAQLAGGVVAEGEDAAGGVEDDRVVVARGEGGDGKAFEGRDFVAHVDGGRPGRVVQVMPGTPSWPRVGKAVVEEAAEKTRPEEVRRRMCSRPPEMETTLSPLIPGGWSFL